MGGKKMTGRRRTNYKKMTKVQLLSLIETWDERLEPLRKEIDSQRETIERLHAEEGIQEVKNEALERKMQEMERGRENLFHIPLKLWITSVFGNEEEKLVARKCREMWSQLYGGVELSELDKKLSTWEGRIQ
jgi:hypothetical protein